jgi:hypothetical protein
MRPAARRIAVTTSAERAAWHCGTVSAETHKPLVTVKQCAFRFVENRRLMTNEKAAQCRPRNFMPSGGRI